MGGTTGVTYNAAIVDRPLLDEASASLDGAVTAATIGDDGLLTLEDGFGGRAYMVLDDMEVSFCP